MPTTGYSFYRIIGMFFCFVVAISCAKVTWGDQIWVAKEFSTIWSSNLLGDR